MDDLPIGVPIPLESNQGSVPVGQLIMSDQTETEMIESLVSMGFPIENAKKAVKITGASSAEQAAGWLIDHGDEIDQIALPGELVLLVRTDLGMSPGKVAAQCGHAVLGAYRAAARQNDGGLVTQWEVAGEAIIVLGVGGEGEMRELEARAREDQGITTHIVTDAGRTEVAPGSSTVAALGPAPVSRIDAVTGHLSLL